MDCIVLNGTIGSVGLVSGGSVVLAGSQVQHSPVPFKFNSSSDVVTTPTQLSPVLRHLPLGLAFLRPVVNKYGQPDVSCMVLALFCISTTVTRTRRQFKLSPLVSQRRCKP